MYSWSIIRLSLRAARTTRALGSLGAGTQGASAATGRRGGGLRGQSPRPPEGGTEAQKATRGWAWFTIDVWFVDHSVVSFVYLSFVVVFFVGLPFLLRALFLYRAYLRYPDYCLRSFVF